MERSYTFLGTVGVWIERSLQVGYPLSVFLLGVLWPLFSGFEAFQFARIFMGIFTIFKMWHVVHCIRHDIPIYLIDLDWDYDAEKIFVLFIASSVFLFLAGYFISNLFTLLVAFN